MCALASLVVSHPATLRFETIAAQFFREQSSLTLHPLSSLKKALAHEMGHVLGLYHEHQRGAPPSPPPSSKALIRL